MILQGMFGQHGKNQPHLERPELLSSQQVRNLTEVVPRLLWEHPSRASWSLRFGPTRRETPLALSCPTAECPVFVLRSLVSFRSNQFTSRVSMNFHPCAPISNTYFALEITPNIIPSNLTLPLYPHTALMQKECSADTAPCSLLFRSSFKCGFVSHCLSTLLVYDHSQTCSHCSERELVCQTPSFRKNLSMEWSLPARACMALACAVSSP